jgi:4-hydroxythreonine-4-phosphate dehydrogenase
MSTTEIADKPEKRIRLGISHGDINGISYEVIIKAFSDSRMLDLCTPIIYGSSKIASYHRKTLNLPDFSFNLIKRADMANPRRANIINITEEEIKIELGTSTEIAGKMAHLSLQAAVNDLQQGLIDVLVTAPINKYNIQSAGFAFPGHTEFLGSQCNVKEPLMLLVSGNLRMGLVTGHVPLSKVAAMLSEDLILRKIRAVSNSLLQDFGIHKPSIAVLGLNPHAGDNGLLGEEENKIIIPAIKKACDEGHNVFGPYASDGFFGSARYSAFDAILAMYHDQGLIPFKTIAFDSGVNFTAGLPFVRTSPDHGTAYDLAGKDMASPDSLRAAVYLACDIFAKRTEYKTISANPLKTAKLEPGSED